MKEIIFSVLVVIFFSVSAVPAHAIINWTEDRVKAVCLDAVMEAQMKGIIPLPTSISANSQQTNSNIESRMASVEDRLSTVEKLFNTLSGLLVQLISMLSKIIK